MRILFLLLVALFISPTFAQVDERNICYTNDIAKDFYGVYSVIPKECKVGNILVVWYTRSSTPQPALTKLASEYCDYEKQIKIEAAYLSCELARKTPRENVGLKENPFW